MPNKNQGDPLMKLFSRVILPFILFIYIAIETYAKLNHTSICGSTGCELAGELLRFPSIYLNYFGALGALAMAIFGYLSFKNKSFEKLFFITLYAAIAFESIMIAYQVIANPEPCIFCMGVYGGLLLIAMISNWKYFIYALVGIAAIFISINSLAVTQNRAIMADDGVYLIHSPTCPHCKYVKKYFADHNVSYHKILVYSPNARFFIKQLGIDSIPVLIIKNKNTSRIIKGDKDIIAHYETLNKPKKTVTKNESDGEIPNLKAKDEGECSASIQKKDERCEQESEVPLK
jgi:glutaredoxin